MRKCNHIGPFTHLRTFGITEMANKQSNESLDHCSSLHNNTSNVHLSQYVLTKAKYKIRQQRYMLTDEQ